MKKTRKESDIVKDLAKLYMYIGTIIADHSNRLSLYSRGCYKTANDIHLKIEVILDRNN